MSVADQAEQFATTEREAIDRLVNAGFDAFLNGNPSSLKGGVAVRVNVFDPRVGWTSRRLDAVPLGNSYSTYGHTFVLHGGRVLAKDDVNRLRAFVDGLLASAAALAVA